MEKYYIIPKQLLDDVYNYMVKSPIEGTLDLILNRIIQQNYESYPEATTDKGSAGWPEEG